MGELAVLLVAALGAWLVYDGLRAREAAIVVARRTCEAQRLQFLDDTVRKARTRFARTGQGNAALRRTFVFEFSEDGVSRRAGKVVMVGAEAEEIVLDPYRA